MHPAYGTEAVVLGWLHCFRPEEEEHHSREGKDKAETLLKGASRQESEGGGRAQDSPLSAHP